MTYIWSLVNISFIQQGMPYCSHVSDSSIGPRCFSTVRFITLCWVAVHLFVSGTCAYRSHLPRAILVVVSFLIILSLAGLCGVCGRCATHGQWVKYDSVLVLPLCVAPENVVTLPSCMCV